MSSALCLFDVDVVMLISCMPLSYLCMLISVVCYYM